jgi:hypothetical protein
MTEETKPCPVCNAPVPYWKRYPGLLCNKCSERTTDQAGRRVTFYNQSICGGCLGVYIDEEKPYDSNYCYVDGVECIADEHRFGGIVVQAAQFVKDE